jgi:hypothetical protein
MTWKIYLFLFLSGFFVAFMVSGFQTNPGYMDAEYYYSGALRLANGYGFSEDILWNYLDDPNGLPHPSHGYWQPLPTIVGWLGLSVFLRVRSSFTAAQTGFLFVTGLISPFTAALAYKLTNKRFIAILAGFQAVFAGYYLPFLTTSDAFGLYMLFGISFLLTLPNNYQRDKEKKRYILVGAISGLMNLTRADGSMWLFIAIMLIFGKSVEWNLLRRNRQLIKNIEIKEKLISVTFVLCGYLLIMIPWMGRNLSLFGNLFAPGGLRTIWLTNYDELFSYPASQLTFSHWWKSGLTSILNSRWSALKANLATALVVQGGIVLSPLVIIGMWKLREDRRVITGIIAWLLTLLVMSFVFPFSGWRGGFFHSGAALQPLFWTLIAVGLTQFIRWGEKKRRWNTNHARKVLGVGVVLVFVGLAGFRFYQRVMGSGENSNVWGRSANTYILLEDVLQAAGASPKDIVMVNNPPGYYATNGRPSIVIPDGDVSTLLNVAKRYRAKYLWLENNHAKGLNSLYEDPGDRPGLKFITAIQGSYLFSIELIE